ncbi:MAG: DMT family transporter [Rhodospirillales bacterium]|jgi:drug/metabolite transporter (DMT)-like permease|nr:DMT family transporter [Rhodospirillales bacterium]
MSVTTEGRGPVRSPFAVRPRIDARAGAILVLCCALWGLQQVGIKLAAQEGIPPILQAALRSVGATVLLLGWAFARGQGRALFARDGSFRAGLGLAGMFSAEFLLLYPGLQLTTASRAVVILYSAPFWVAVGVHLLVPGERLALRQVIGLLAAFAGVLCAVADGLVTGGGRLSGDLLVAAAAAAWGLTTVAMKASPRLNHLSATKLLLYQLAGSIPVLFAFAWASGELHVGAATPAAWAWLGYQTVVVAFASYLTWFWLITRYPAGRLSAYTFLSPLFGILAGVAILGEHATPGLLLALVFVAVGIRLVNGRAPVPAAAPSPRQRQI